MLFAGNGENTLRKVKLEVRNPRTLKGNLLSDGFSLRLWPGMGTLSVVNGPPKGISALLWGKIGIRWAYFVLTFRLNWAYFVT